MSEPLECGHTEEEHKEMARERNADQAMALLQGDFTSLFQTMETQMLQTNLESILLEMYLRATDDEMFADYFSSVVDGVREILLPEEGVESSNPEVLDYAKQARAEVQEAIKDDQFMTEATDELRVMLEQHGVAEAERKEESDDFPGFYL